MSYTENGHSTIKRICHCCVGELYLADEINSTGLHAECSYCGESAPSIDIGELAERIETAFSDHYVRTSDQPNSWQERLMSDRESNYDWDRDGIPVNEAIQEAADIDEDAAADLLEILQDRNSPVNPSDNIGEESEFDFDSYYERKHPTFIGLHMGWQEFEQTLKTKSRFFSRTAVELLSRIFGGADKLSTRQGRPLIVDAGPETQLDHLYRARVFQADDGLEDALCRPAARIGSPPSKMARAGRMNAQGISVFYGATKSEVAIAEVRPPVGSRAVVARFDITRPLRLLDLVAANDVYEEGSVFDPSFKERLHRAEFLRSLRWRMARPVMPDDEGIDYLPTQAVADFLATANDPRLDGIIFPSVQVKDGNNVVLFHESARVEKEVWPEGTEIEANTGFDGEDGWEADYSVQEILPLVAVEKSNGSADDYVRTFLHQSAWLDANADDRPITLRLVTTSVEVHHVNWVKVDTEAHSVHRYRVEKGSSEF